MNFKKIKNEPGGLPAFEALCILLSDGKNGAHHCHIGYLKSIEKDGPVFVEQVASGINTIMDKMFGTSIQSKDPIVFTHWCKLVIDEIEE